MIIDGLLIFEPVAGTAITVTAVSTNVIDLSVARDVGIGDNPAMKIAMYIKAAFTAAGAGTLQVQAQGAPDNGAGAPGTFVTLAESRAYSLAELALGNRIFPIDWPSQGVDLVTHRFLRLNYIVATGPMTAGSIFAALVLDRQESPQYPAGVTISN